MDKVLYMCVETKIPPIQMSVKNIIQKGPVVFSSNIGEVSIFPPNTQDKLPQAIYIHSNNNSKNELETRISPWEADTIWALVKHKADTSLSENEIHDKLMAKYNQIIFRFFKLIRRKLPKAPIPLPPELKSSYNFQWGQWDPTSEFYRSSLSFRHKPGTEPDNGLTDAKWHELEQEMISGAETTLWEDFIIDAKVAFEEEDLNRTVIYAAISCELFINGYILIHKKRNINIPKDYYRIPKDYCYILYPRIGNSLNDKITEETCHNLNKLFIARNDVMHKGKVSPLLNRAEISEYINSLELAISWVKQM